MNLFEKQSVILTSHNYLVKYPKITVKCEVRQSRDLPQLPTESHFASYFAFYHFALLPTPDIFALRVLFRSRINVYNLKLNTAYTLSFAFINNCIGLRRTASDCIGPVPDGEMFTLSVRQQEYLMKVILYGLRCSAVGRTLIRQGSVY